MYILYVVFTKQDLFDLLGQSLGNVLTMFFITTFFKFCLKVPKREIFVTELFTRSDPIWIGDTRIEPIKPFV